MTAPALHRGRRAIAPLIFLLALLLRLGWLAYGWQHSGSALQFDDEKLHWQLARNLVNEGTLVTDDGRYAARMPAYPLFLAPFAMLAENGILAARAAQALLGALAALLVYLFVRNAMAGETGWPASIAGLLAAIDPYSIFFTTLLLTEVLFMLLAIALVFSARKLLASTPNTLQFALFGTLSALALLTRQSALGWLAILAIWITWRTLCTPKSIARLGLSLACAAALILPWGIRNDFLFGTPAWLSTNGGVTLYDGQGPQARGDSDQRFLSQLNLAGLTEVGADVRLHELAIAQMRADPNRVLRLAAVKFARTWNPLPNFSEYSSGVAAWASALFSIPLYLAAAIGAIRLRKQRSLLALLLLPIIYFTIVHCIYVGSLRYRIPLMPFLEILAAAALLKSARVEKSPPQSQVSIQPPPDDYPPHLSD